MNKKGVGELLALQGLRVFLSRYRKLSNVSAHNSYGFSVIKIHGYKISLLPIKTKRGKGKNNFKERRGGLGNHTRS